MKYEQSLGIKTSGLREWKKKGFDYHRYEATPYQALRALFQEYKLKKTDEVVDFGCGRGRVSFYIHHHFHIPVTGIEVNDLTYDEALDNKARYRQRAKHITAPLYFEYGLAEQYDVKETQNVFYFFNPFSVQIFEKVIKNILYSVANSKRPIDLILYYPMPDYVRFLRMHTSFRLINKVKVPGAKDPREMFKIYRLT